MENSKISVKQFLKNFENMLSCKTLYVMGGFGCALTEKRKEKILSPNGYTYNKKPERKWKIIEASADTFGFDCGGAIKGNLWGFVGDPNKVYGGAVYKSNGVPDVSALGFLKSCSDISTDFNKIIPGAFLYMSNHCGVYKGNGDVYEASPAYKDGFQITKLSQRKWLKWGLLTPYVDYGAQPKPSDVPPLALPSLMIGDRGMQVLYLQKDLNYTINAGLQTDGIFGKLTRAAVAEFQKQHSGLVVDGIYGNHTYRVMREVLNNGN